MEKNPNLPSPPIITVITATYNSSQTLKLTIESVLAQDFTDFEVWVVGDACTDDSRAVVESFKDKRLNWTNLLKNSGGQGIPNNEGIRRAKGKYIAYLGHDDLWFPWHLSTLVRFIQKTESDLVHPLGAVFSPRGLEKIVGPPSSGRTYQSHCGFPSFWLHLRDIVNDNNVGYWADHRTLNCSVDHHFIKQIENSGKKISCYPRISLLKFPSPIWGTYKSDLNPGQSQYFEKMQKSPENLEKYILNQTAYKLALCLNPRKKFYVTLKGLIRIPVDRFIDTYGRNRWPLKQLIRWRFWHIRKKLQVKRGLPRNLK